jgi:hypothetical protein
MVNLAGGLLGNAAANSWLSSAKTAKSEMRTVVCTTRSRLLPPATRTVFRFLNAWVPCSRKVAPAARPVAGSMPAWPDTNSSLPARTACE